MKNIGFKKAAIVVALASIFAAPITSQATTSVTATQPTAASILFTAPSDEISNANAVTVSADASELYLGRQTAFTVLVQLTNAKFTGTTAPVMTGGSALLYSAGGGLPTFAAASSAWVITTISGGTSGTNAVSYAVSPVTGVNATVSAGNLVQFASDSITVANTSLATGTPVQISVKIVDPASSTVVSNGGTGVTLFTSSNPVLVTSSAGSSLQKVDVGSTNTQVSKTYFSPTGAILTNDSAYFQVGSYTITSSATTGNCYGDAIANCSNSGVGTADHFIFNSAADTQTITLNGSTLNAFLTAGSVFIADTAVATNCSGATANATATIASHVGTTNVTSITLTPAHIPMSGGNFIVCLKAPTNVAIPAQTLTVNDVLAVADTANVTLAQTSFPLTSASLAYNGTVRVVYYVNPANNANTVQNLRVSNPTATGGVVTITGVLDNGNLNTTLNGGGVSFTLPAYTTVNLDQVTLEAGSTSNLYNGVALAGSLGAAPVGQKWTLTVTGQFPNMQVISYVNTGGVLTNMSNTVDPSIAVQNAQ